MELFFEPYFALFLIIFLGYLLGKIKVKGISIDVSAVLFVALAFGYYGVVLPSEFKVIGLVLFIFTIGFQAGPSFFETFRKEGIRLFLLAFIIVFTGALVTVCCAIYFSFSKELAGGLFAGAITSTPGLAALTELSHNNDGIIGYGIAYPFGVIGVVVFVKILPGLFKMSISKAEKKYSLELSHKYPKVLNRNFVVENPEIIGKSLKELQLREKTGSNISRILQNGVAFTPSNFTVLKGGSIIKAVGTEESLIKVQEIVGKPTELGIALNENYDVRFIVVTNKKVLDKTISELHIQSRFNIIITRIRRSGIDFSPTSNIKLHFGDKIKVAGTREDINMLAAFLGDEASKLYDNNYIPIALGIVLGIILGVQKLKIGVIELSPGLTGGVMAVAIILSRVRKTGPLVFSLTTGASQIFRQIGLLLFLAVVGTEAGANIIAILKTDGLSLLLSGVLVTVLPMIFGVLFAKYVLKIGVLQILGALTGGMTSTPGLAAASSMTKTNSPGICYATIYPIAMILVLIFVQVIFIIL